MALDFDNRSKVPEIALYIVIALIIVITIGTLGFHYLAELSWIDAFHSACLHVSGVGATPDIIITSNKGKLFSAIYSLIAGMTFLAIFVFFIDIILELELLNKNSNTKTLPGYRT